MVKNIHIRDEHEPRNPRTGKKRKHSDAPVSDSSKSTEPSPEPPAKRAPTNNSESLATSAAEQGSFAANKVITDAQLLVIGLNEVTKLLERDGLRLVVVARQMEPSRIIQHLPILCTLKKVPILAAPVNNTELAQFFRLQSTVCFAIKVRFSSDWYHAQFVSSHAFILLWLQKSADPSCFDAFLALALEKAVAPQVPWINDQMRAIAKENIKKFAEVAAQAATLKDDEPRAIDVEHRLTEKALLPLHMKRAETEKEVVPSNKGKPKQIVDPDNMQE